MRAEPNTVTFRLPRYAANTLRQYRSSCSAVVSSFTSPRLGLVAEELVGRLLDLPGVRTPVGGRAGDDLAGSGSVRASNGVFGVGDRASNGGVFDGAGSGR